MAHVTTWFVYVTVPWFAVAAEGVARGAYVLREDDDAAVTLVATGSEVAVALDAVPLLAERGVVARVVSMPCWEWFEATDEMEIAIVDPHNTATPYQGVIEGDNPSMTYQLPDGEVDVPPVPTVEAEVPPAAAEPPLPPVMLFCARAGEAAATRSATADFVRNVLMCPSFNSGSI